MARLPRFTVAGQPHLLIQSTKDVARPAFADDDDRRFYLQALEQASRICGVAVHAYVLLNDSVLLLATPDEADALGRLMQRTARHYVPAFNRRHGRFGPLWDGRFGAAVIDAEHYLLKAIRFVEQAPVRAGLVADARDWPWSSVEHHLGRTSPSPLVQPHRRHWELGNTPFEREARHEAQLSHSLSGVEIDELSTALRRGWPLGSATFSALISQSSGRPSKPRPRGRPRAASV